MKNKTKITKHRIKTVLRKKKGWSIRKIEQIFNEIKEWWNVNKIILQN